MGSMAEQPQDGGLGETEMWEVRREVYDNRLCGARNTKYNRNGDYRFRPSSIVSGCIYVSKPTMYV